MKLLIVLTPLLSRADSSISSSSDDRGSKSEFGVEVADNSKSDIDSKTIVVRSDHPYRTPIDTCGRIDLPTSYSHGGYVYFHPKSRLCSPHAALSFYISTQAFEEDKPFHVANQRENIGIDGRWKSFIVPAGTKNLYYSFKSASKGIGPYQCDNPRVKHPQDSVEVTPSEQNVWTVYNTGLPSYRTTQVMRRRQL